ncbi:MAG: hypothetical protein IJO76_03115 [Clostridia bacterium]|nr:hypothetical protein [Clostridia bacterium]
MRNRWKAILWVAGTITLCFVLLLPVLFWYSLFHTEVHTYDSLTPGQQTALEELVGFTFPKDMTNITCVFSQHWDGAVLELEAPYSHAAFAAYVGLADVDAQREIDCDAFGSFTPPGAAITASFETVSRLDKAATNGEYIYFVAYDDNLDYATFLKAE